MHVVVTKPSDPKIPLFFNLDSSVGHHGQNSRPEDIQLVQFLLHQIAEGAKASRPGGEARRQRMLKVPLSGNVDDATIDAIRAWQEGRKEEAATVVIDGRVSVARGTFYAPGAEWTIADLNAIFRMLFPNIWPRLQDHPKCPALLKTRVPQVL
jgi:hypothetical protein